MEVIGLNINNQLYQTFREAHELSIDGSQNAIEKLGDMASEAQDYLDSIKSQNFLAKRSIDDIIWTQFFTRSLWV